MPTYVQSPFFDSTNARSEELPPRPPLDLSTVQSADDFRGLSGPDRNRLFMADPDRYDRLRDAVRSGRRG